jgi:copper chaperone CopZ
MQLQIELENIKCGGCAATIKKRLLEDARIKSVDVDVATGAVTLDATENDLVSWKASLVIRSAVQLKVWRRPKPWLNRL